MTPKKNSLWSDYKFRWLIFSVLVVAVFEFLSLAGWHLSPGIAVPFFAFVILLIGHRTLFGGLRALLKLNFRSINLLLLIASIGAFYLGEYEEAAVVIVLFTLGERLEQFGIQTSRSALQALVDRTPKTAAVKDAQGVTKEVPVSEIVIGDLLVIKPSDMIAVDAEVVSGSSSVDESTITGEPRAYRGNQGSFGAIVPRNPVSQGGWGHWDIIARYDFIDVSDTDGGSARGEQTAYAIGLNWVPVDHVRLMLNYAQSEMDRVTGVDDEAQVVSLRTQFDF